MNIKKIINSLTNTDGYYSNLKISKKEISHLYRLIKDSFLNSLLENKLDNKEKFKKINLKYYHRYSHLFNHQIVTRKKNRLFKPKLVSEIKKMDFFKKLKEIFPSLKIASFEKIYKEEIDWRIVRPKIKSDIGPLHRDEWFWHLNKIKINKNITPFKVWIPIITENKKNGLAYVPKSHLLNISLKKITKRIDGKFKPGKLNKKFKHKIFSGGSQGNIFILTTNYYTAGSLAVTTPE